MDLRGESKKHKQDFVAAHQKAKDAETTAVNAQQNLEQKVQEYHNLLSRYEDLQYEYDAVKRTQYQTVASIQKQLDEANRDLAASRDQETILLEEIRNMEGVVDADVQEQMKKLKEKEVELGRAKKERDDGIASLTELKIQLDLLKKTNDGLVVEIRGMGFYCQC